MPEHETVRVRGVRLQRIQAEAWDGARQVLLRQQYQGKPERSGTHQVLLSFAEKEYLKGLCHEMNIIFEGL
jgi:hypothetical protein